MRPIVDRIISFIGCTIFIIQSYIDFAEMLVHDEEVLNAIYHHSDGLSHSKLAMIIYIADKREPLRQIDDNILNLAYSDLYKAFEVLKCDVKEYVLKHGNK